MDKNSVSKYPIFTSLIKKVVVFSLISLLLLQSLPLTVTALSTEQQELIKKNILYYEPSCEGGVCECLLDSETEESVDIKESTNDSIYSSGLSEPFILEQWAIHVLKALAQKTGEDESNYVTKEHTIALVAFALGEGGDINNTSSIFNPLNTGLNAPELLNGANAVDGTQSFKSFDAGVEGTARTMLGSNQNRLAKTLSKKDSSARDFMTALTYYQRYRGNQFWAAASLPPNQDSYYQERLSLIKQVRENYKDIASIVIGTQALEQQNGTKKPDKLQFDGSSDGSTPSDDAEVTTGCSCRLPGDSSGEVLSDGNNRVKAFSFFVEKGATPIQAAGIVGNFMQESGLDLDTNASNGTHEGIAQWDRQIRWARLLEFANKPEFKDKGPRSLLVQLEFAYQEEPMKSYLKETPDSPEEAAELFEAIFERSGGSALENRRNYAKDVFNEVGSPEQGTESESDSCPTSGGGTQTVTADGYALPVKREGVNLPCEKSTCHHDRTPAADLGITDEWEGTPVYAIVDGVIDNFHYRAGFGKLGPAPQECKSLQLVGDDGWQYWYGHIREVSVNNGDKVKAGQQIAVIGQSRCADDTPPHLHIDRGSPKGSAGGSECCRDPGFVPLLNKIFEESR